MVSLSELSDPLGGTLGLTIMTTVFNNVAGFGADSDTTGSDFVALQYLPPEAIERITAKAKEGIVWAFVAICPFMLLVLRRSWGFSAEPIVTDGVCSALLPRR